MLISMTTEVVRHINIKPLPTQRKSLPKDAKLQEKRGDHKDLLLVWSGRLIVFGV